MTEDLGAGLDTVIEDLGVGLDAVAAALRAGRFVGFAATERITLSTIIPT